MAPEPWLLRAMPQLRRHAAHWHYRKLHGARLSRRAARANGAVASFGAAGWSRGPPKRSAWGCKPRECRGLDTRRMAIAGVPVTPEMAAELSVRLGLRCAQPPATHAPLALL